ncbi:MAG: RNA methyltransferase [Nitrospiraceae bacterium]|nr:RNA methyltransferase [Nitrospiraceae bacterium]
MEYMLISSPSNSRIKKAIRIRERKHAEGDNLFVLEGPKIIEMALAAGAKIREVFFTDHFTAKNEGKELLGLLSKKTTDICRVADHVFAKLSDTETPQGIAAVASYPVLSLDRLPLSATSLYVVLDGVRDPGNLGTIIRTSDAAGVDAVILLEGTCDAFIPKVIRATAGSIFNVPLVLAADDQLMAWRQGHGIKIAVTAADAPRSVFEADLTVPVAFIFGNEARGVRRAIKDGADLLLKIPLYGKAESLNVATSAAICLYEAVRQRRGPKTP